MAGRLHWLEAQQQRLLQRALKQRLINSQDVEDAVQDTWIALLGRWPADTSLIDRVSTTILRNLAIDARRRAAIRYVERDCSDLPAPSQRCSYADGIGELLRQLPAIYATALTKRYLESKSVQQVSLEMEVTEECTKTRLKRGKARLRRLLRESGARWDLGPG